MITYDEVLRVLQNFRNPQEIIDSPLYDLQLVHLRIAVDPVKTSHQCLMQILAEAKGKMVQEGLITESDILNRFWEDKTQQEVQVGHDYSISNVRKLQHKAITRLTQILVEQEERCQTALKLDCGDRGMPLHFRRANIFQTFGAYFASMLEASNNYVQLLEQVDYHSKTMDETFLLPGLTRILYEIRKPKGSRVIFIAGAGGTGKTTITTKLVRCLYEEEDADIILGDSAKHSMIDVHTGTLRKLDSGFADSLSFYLRLCRQLSIPINQSHNNPGQLVKRISNAIRDMGHRAVIVIDNLDTLTTQESKALFMTLQPLLTREIRAIVTARHIEYVPEDAVLVSIRPLEDNSVAYRFLEWHMLYHSIPHFETLRHQIDWDRTDRIVQLTGGIPLVMQLILNEVANKGWSYLDKSFPHPQELLQFLYDQHWKELSNLGQSGQLCQELATLIARRQNIGEPTTIEFLSEWSNENKVAQDGLFDSLSQLQKRFLIINHDLDKGNYSTFPSFEAFVLSR